MYTLHCCSLGVVTCDDAVQNLSNVKLASVVMLYRGYESYHVRSGGQFQCVDDETLTSIWATGVATTRSCVEDTCIDGTVRLLYHYMPWCSTITYHITTCKNVWYNMQVDMPLIYEVAFFWSCQTGTYLLSFVCGYLIIFICLQVSQLQTYYLTHWVACIFEFILQVLVVSGVNGLAMPWQWPYISWQQRLQISVRFACHWFNRPVPQIKMGCSQETVLRTRTSLIMLSFGLMGCTNTSVPQVTLPRWHYSIPMRLNVWISIFHRIVTRRMSDSTLKGIALWLIGDTKVMVPILYSVLFHPYSILFYFILRSSILFHFNLFHSIILYYITIYYILYNIIFYYTTLY